MDMERRVDELESKLSLLDDLVDTLNLTLYRQQQHIARLESGLAELAARLEAAGPRAAAERHEVPPHY